jgi:hypothetical protein
MIGTLDEHALGLQPYELRSEDVACRMKEHDFWKRSQPILPEWKI